MAKYKHYDYSQGKFFPARSSQMSSTSEELGPGKDVRG